MIHPDILRAPIIAPRLLDVLTATSLALLAVLLVVLPLDPRELGGDPVWAKPAKFAASFSIFFATIGLLETSLSPGWRNGRLLSRTGQVMAVAFLGEMAYIVVQAGQAEPSHFNETTPFHSAMYALMGVGAVCLVGGAAIFGLAALADREARLSPGIRLGVALGFVLSCLLTLVVAGTMSRNGSHFVGQVSAADPRLPLMGWSLSTGDLRPAHFLSLHAMQALPLLGWAADRWRPREAFPLVLAGAALWTAATLALFALALAGQPVLPF